MDIEVFADRHAEETKTAHEIRYEEAVQEYMLELGCTRQIAEIKVEQEIGANPDKFYPEVY